MEFKEDERGIIGPTPICDDLFAETNGFWGGVNGSFIWGDLIGSLISWSEWVDFKLDERGKKE